MYTVVNCLNDSWSSPTEVFIIQYIFVEEKLTVKMSLQLAVNNLSFQIKCIVLIYHPLILGVGQQQPIWGYLPGTEGILIFDALDKDDSCLSVRVWKWPSSSVICVENRNEEIDSYLPNIVFSVYNQCQPYPFSRYARQLVYNRRKNFSSSFVMEGSSFLVLSSVRLDVHFITDMLSVYS